MAKHYGNCHEHLPYAKITGQSRRRRFYTFGGGTKRRSSLAPALAHACAVPGVGVEVPMDERGRPLAADGGSAAVPRRLLP